MSSPSLVILTLRANGDWHWMVFACAWVGSERHSNFLHEGCVGSRADALAHSADVLEAHGIPMTSGDIITLTAPR